MIKHKPFLISYKLFFGLLGFSAIVTELVVLIERGVFNPVNFFSFFTIQSNLLLAVTLFLSAIFVALGKNQKLSMLRGATAVYMAIVGIVFPLLLAGLVGVQLTAVPWDNTVLHYILPAVAVLDFLIDRPVKIRFTRALVWLIFPATYAVYSLVRGTIVGWYPYPFLNPSNGVTALVVTIAGIVGLTLFLTWGASALSKKKVN